MGWRQHRLFAHWSRPSPFPAFKEGIPGITATEKLRQLFQPFKRHPENLK